MGVRPASAAPLSSRSAVLPIILDKDTDSKSRCLSAPRTTPRQGTRTSALSQTHSAKLRRYQQSHGLIKEESCDDPSSSSPICKNGVPAAIPLTAGATYGTLRLSAQENDTTSMPHCDVDALGWAAALEMLHAGVEHVAPMQPCVSQGEPWQLKQTPGNASKHSTPQRPATAHPMSRSAVQQSEKLDRDCKQLSRPITAVGLLHQSRSSNSIHACQSASSISLLPTDVRNVSHLAISFVSTISNLLQRVTNLSGQLFILQLRPAQHHGIESSFCVVVNQRWAGPL